MEKIQIQDESGDRNYFTIIPNYIANHSTANDQALYFQMKKHAGEKGECFASEVLLRKKLKIGTKALKKSIKYLVDNKWIREDGYKEVKTRGGIQKVKVYSINDIWKMNNDFYKGYAESTPLKDKGYVESNARVCQKEDKGMPEEQLIRTKGIRTIEEDIATQVSQEEIKEIPTNEQPIQATPLPVKQGSPQVIKLFECINPDYKDWFGNPTQRASAEKLLLRAPFDKLEELITGIMPILNSTPYNPKDCKAFSPFELNRNWAKIMAKIKEKSIEAIQEKGRGIKVSGL